jgi:hypothetical protein
MCMCIDGVVHGQHSHSILSTRVLPSVGKNTVRCIRIFTDWSMTPWRFFRLILLHIWWYKTPTFHHLSTNSRWCLLHYYLYEAFTPFKGAVTGFFSGFYPIQGCRFGSGKIQTFLVRSWFRKYWPDSNPTITLTVQIFMNENFFLNKAFTHFQVNFLIFSDRYKIQHSNIYSIDSWKNNSSKSHATVTLNFFSWFLSYMNHNVFI